MHNAIKQQPFLCPYLSNYFSSFINGNQINFCRKSSCQIDIENIFTDQSSIKDTVFEIYQKKEILTSDNEEEDTETMSAKKDLDKTSCYISFFNQQNAESFTAYFKEPLAFSKELSYLPSSNSSLYIIFEVFRI